MQVLKEEIKEKIIAAATQEFLEKGFLAASTREIVKRVQISKGNLYNYFQSKEELFYAVTTPFYHQFQYFLQQLCGHAGEENFSLENVALLSGNTAEFILKYRDPFVVIMDRSAGTQYAGLKEETVAALQKHFAQNIKPIIGDNADSRMAFMRIIARNFIEALLAIARDCHCDEEAAAVIGLYLKYHIQGVAQFY